MKIHNITYKLKSILMIGFVLSACSGLLPGSSIPAENDQAEIGLANPAAVYCEGLGYGMEAVERDGGMDADCILPDGSRCSQWDLLSGRCGQEYTYCEMQGGIIQEGANIGNCVYSDGSTCDEFQYYSGECSMGDNPGEMAAEQETSQGADQDQQPLEILTFVSARDYLAEYLTAQYGIEMTEPWMEQNITPEDAVGISTLRFVSGPLTIVITAEASAPGPALFTIKEATNIANGFYWEGTLLPDGTINEGRVIPISTILNEAQARDAVLEYLIEAYGISPSGGWIDGGISQTGNGSVEMIYASEAWTVTVDFIPAAPLVSSYHVTVENSSEGIRWEGDISSQGEIDEISFSQ